MGLNMYQNYITGQTTLSLNLDFSIPANHIASVISEFVDSIPNEVILETTSNTGRPAYHPAMMLKILLFAYSRRVFSGRKIERMLEENLPMMILADNRKISYHTINNFRSSDHANKVIKQCFVYFTSLLEDEGLIRENVVFIDGTKIEADANRYTFVWRKAIEKYHAKLKEDVSALYEELINKEVVKAMAEKEDYYVDKSGVRFNFKYYSQRKDRSTGMVRNFKIYEADEFQLTEELTQLAKTKTGRQRQIHYNPNWQYLKEKAKETLQSEEGKSIYGCRKSDVEPIFGHMKSVFGMRRTHLRGKKKVETDVGIMFMTMNLKKYGANKKVKPSNFYIWAKNRVSSQTLQS